METENAQPVSRETFLTGSAPRRVVPSVARPLLELKRFGKITLGVGESGSVEFLLPASELSIPGVDLKPCFEPGAFQFSVGLSADPQALSTIGVSALPC